VETLDDAGPPLVLCYSRTNRIDAEGNPLPNCEDDLNLTMDEPQKRLLHVLENPGHWNPIFGVMRTEALRSTRLIGRYWASDVVLLAQLALMGQFREISERLFYRRYHPGTSYRANDTLEGKATWLDPGNRGRFSNSLFALRLLWEHLSVIRSSQLTPLTRLHCYWTTIAHWVVEWRAIGGDVKRMLHLRTRHIH
jgi:hypothetical protein